MMKRFRFKACRYVPNLIAILVLLAAPTLFNCQRVSAKFIGVQIISAEDLHKALAEPTPPIVIDMREDPAYRRNHIPGAIHLNPESIDGYAVKGSIPRDSRIVVVCSSGWDSQIAAATLMAYGYRKVYSLAGGMHRWQEQGYTLQVGYGSSVDKGMLAPPVVAISLLSQLAMTVAAFVVKPAYIVMSALVFLLLWRKNSGDLVLIRNAMLVFFIGENACTLNYLVAANTSIRLEFLHGLGMVGMFFLLFWGLVRFFDQRVFHYIEPDKTCALQRHCRHCWKKEPVSCGLHRLALWLLPALAFVALTPVTMPLRPFRIVMPVFLSDVVWLKDFWNLFIEFRLYPILGAACFMMAFLWLRRGKSGLLKSQLPFFLALGFTSYSFFRFGLLLTFSENQAWADWWEESTEFIMVAMVVLLLVVFKKQLELEDTWLYRKLKFLRTC
ncbi:MAG: rhodanese-like domain-containing protein [Desulfobacterales bacterium]|nr:MAG: rhodanese-like domain-containing protein [Desulfobacterales bacterium]